MKMIFALTCLASIAATPVMAETFTRDGITYDYTTKAFGEATIISGTVVNTGESFRLKVRGARVSGEMGRRQVSFPLADVQVGAAQGGSTVLAAK